MYKLSKGCVGLNNHGGIEFDLQLCTQIFDPCGFMLSPAIGEEDKRDALFLQVMQGLCGASYGS